ncbi:MAG: hypothetical protein M1830_005121, partial [Pleopsidium flavum]
MSAIASQPTRSDEEGLATARNGDGTLLGGQRHDRVLGNDGAGMFMKQMPSDDGDAEVDISAGQKMLSAVSG